MKIKYLGGLVLLLTQVIATSHAQVPADPKAAMAFNCVHEVLMCAEKIGGLNLVNYTYSSGVYHEQKTSELYNRI